MIDLNKAIARNPLLGLDGPASLYIPDDRTVAIVGPNGSGKSLLVGLINGSTALMSGSADRTPGIRSISFRDTYGAADSGYYLQQRWNSTEYDDVPLVRDTLGKLEESEYGRKVFDMFGLREQMDKPLILLSSGELRKYQLAKVLMGMPRMLIVDNPFIGLDAQTRQQLNELFRELGSAEVLQLVLVLPDSVPVPDYVGTVICMKDRKIERVCSLREYSETRVSDDFSSVRQKVLGLEYKGQDYPGDEVIRMNKVSIRYGERTILSNLDWTVKRGEKWALTGENGSGKSTLLSLVCADNPQSYACDIALFGKKRGSGESIWEIKRHIGYVSPELHRAYNKNVPVLDIVASGMHDRNGMYIAIQEDQIPDCEFWMSVFGILDLKNRPFTQISSGEQRLALLARAFVKDPELLILDEPLHGLDKKNAALAREVIEAFGQRKGKTMIMVTHYPEELPDTITNRLKLIKNS